MREPDVIHVSAYYPPHLGGQEIAVQGLVTQLAVTGVKAEVVTSDRGARRGVIVENGVPVTRLKSIEVGHTPILWLLFSWMLRRARRQTIVHVHMGQFFTPEVVWLTAKLKHFKYVLHVHSDLVQSGPMGMLLPLYRSLVFGREIRGAAGVVVLNDEHRRMIREVYHYSGKVFTMSNGLDEEFFSIAREPAESLSFLFVGRLSPGKNLTALLEAFGKLGSGFTLDVIGDGECREALEEMINLKDLRNVTLHGRLSRAEIRRFYSRSTALILPSLHETQGIVLLEAMASRMPIVCTKIAGIEATARDVAIFIEPTADGICAGIETFVGMSAEARKAMVDAAFLRVEDREWKALIGSYLSLYEEVASS